MMRLIAALIAMLIVTPVSADPCLQLPKPSVTIKRLPEKVTVNTRYSVKSLNNLSAALAPSGNQVLGLTRGNASVEFKTNTPSFTDRAGRWECSSPQITLIYGFSPVTIYVAREFPEGSCAYKEIYEHEMRHLQAYQAHIVSIEKELQEALSARFQSEKPWRGPVGQTASQLQQEFNERWVPYVQSVIKRVDEAQALIDTPEEYERVANACGGEIKKRLR
jgi:hypothetical protein